MLIAEMCGKRVTEATTSEDYLTSVVFGALQYQAMRPFWLRLFAKIYSACQPGRSLLARLEEDAIPITDYELVHLEFWRCLPDGSEPDLILHFQAEGLPPIQLVIEVKLYSSKSVSLSGGDQLVRYLEYLMQHPDDTRQALVYLTSGTRWKDLKETLESKTLSGETRPCALLFSLTWQDVESVCDEVARELGTTRLRSDRICQSLLQGISAYLRLPHIGLNHFDGMRSGNQRFEFELQLHRAVTLFRRSPLSLTDVKSLGGEL